MLEKQTEKCVMRVNWNCSCSESFLKRLPVVILSTEVEPNQFIILQYYSLYKRHEQSRMLTS